MPAAADLSWTDHDVVILAASARVEFVVSITVSSIIEDYCRCDVRVRVEV